MSETTEVQEALNDLRPGMERIAALGSCRVCGEVTRAGQRYCREHAFAIVEAALATEKARAEKHEPPPGCSVVFVSDELLPVLGEWCADPVRVKVASREDGRVVLVFQTVDVQAESAAAHAAQLATKDAEREAAVLAMREACAKAVCHGCRNAKPWANPEAIGVHVDGRYHTDCAALSIWESVPAPTSALDAERERVVRWCYAEVYGERPAEGERGMFGYTREVWDQGFAIYLARALAAAKGGQDGVA